MSDVPYDGYAELLERVEDARRVTYVDAETGRRFVFLSNHFDLPALTVADLYRCRWQVEIFFK